VENERRAPGRWWTWGGGGAICLIAGCNTAQPGPEAPETGVAAADPAGSYGQSACGRCARDACAAAVKTCTADPDCAAYLACTDACSAPRGGLDPACESACRSDASSEAVVAEAQLIDCRARGAGTSCVPCRSADASAGGSVLQQTCPPSADSDPCAHCEEQHCCMTRAACKSRSECAALADCLGGCIVSLLASGCGDAGDDSATEACSMTCGERCNAAHPDGATDYAPLFACSTVYCGAECWAPLADACVECRRRSCLDSYTNLVSTADGYRLAICFRGCRPGDGACVYTCLGEFKDAAAEAQAFFQCFRDQCPFCVIP
jgi:hypothetical protein